MQVLQVHSLARHLLWRTSSVSFASLKSSSSATKTEPERSEDSEEALLKSQEKEKKRVEREKDYHKRHDKKKKEEQKKKKRRQNYNNRGPNGKRTRSVSERSKVMKGWKETKRQRKRGDSITSSSSSSDEASSSPSTSVIRSSSSKDTSRIVAHHDEREPEHEALHFTLASVVEAVDGMLDQLSERKMKLMTRLGAVSSGLKQEVLQSIDEIKRLEWALKPLRLQVLQSLKQMTQNPQEEGMESGTTVGIDSIETDPLISRFLFLQSQYDRLM